MVQEEGSIASQSDYLSKSDELARGPITENGIEPEFVDELHTPYTSGEGYSTNDVDHTLYLLVKMYYMLNRLIQKII